MEEEEEKGKKARETEMEGERDWVKEGRRKGRMKKRNKLMMFINSGR